jgi:hypothetical protein
VVDETGRRVDGQVVEKGSRLTGGRCRTRRRGFFVVSFYSGQAEKEKKECEKERGK